MSSDNPMKMITEFLYLGIAVSIRKDNAHHSPIATRVFLWEMRRKERGDIKPVF